MELAYTYKARGHLGEVSGIIYAERIAFARAKLKKMGLKPRSVRIAPIHSLFGTVKKGFDQRELEQFYRYLSRLQEKGVPLATSLSDAVNTVNDIRLKGAIAIMSDAASGSGMTLSQAMMLGGFPTRDADLVRNVEASGGIHKVLASLADEISRAESIRRTIKKLLMMPTFMYFLMASVLYLSIVFMAPRIYGLFKNVLTNVELPDYALFYYESCELFNNNRLIGTALYVGAVIGFAVFTRSDYVKSLIELFKPIRIARQKADYAALWGTFSLLFDAGIHKEEICRGLARAAVTKEAKNCFTRMASFIRDGRDVDEAVTLAKFPLYIVNPVCSAQKSMSLVEGTKDLSEKLIIDIEVFSGRAAFWVEASLYIVVAIFVLFFAMLTVVPLLLSIFTAV